MVFRASGILPPGKPAPFAGHGQLSGDAARNGDKLVGRTAALPGGARPASVLRHQTAHSSTLEAPDTNVHHISESPQAEIESHSGRTPVVYMTADISPRGLMATYAALGRKANGHVAVKISTGEPGGSHYLKSGLIKDFVLSVGGSFVECNTAYGGSRDDSATHMKVAKDHGFTAYTSLDIMDKDGTVGLPIRHGIHLKEDVVGSHLHSYDFLVVLSHFKGHMMGGFGGAVKNMSIGIASPSGKCLIHTAGASTTSIWGGDQDEFLESMAEAASAVADLFGDRILYINVMNNLSVDCDCVGHPAAPTMADIGILASLDPVALDQACVDLTYAAPDGRDLIERFESRHAVHTLTHAEGLGLGSTSYELIRVDEMRP